MLAEIINVKYLEEFVFDNKETKRVELKDKIFKSFKEAKMNIDVYNWDEIDKICNGLYVEKTDDDVIDYGALIRYCKDNKIEYSTLTEKFVEENFKQK